MGSFVRNANIRLYQKLLEEERDEEKKEGYPPFIGGGDDEVGPRRGSGGLQRGQVDG